MTASQFINNNEHRRGAVPTPDGALPLQRRRRKGMLNLKAWDEHVAATNAANGTASLSEKVDMLQMIAPNATASAEEQLAEAGQRQAEEAPPRPRDPDEGDDVVTGDKPPAMTSGAILEDTQIESTQPPINLPPPTAAGIKAAKAALAADEESSKVPPPKVATKRQTKTTADQ